MASSYEDLLKNIQDEANMTDAELQSRLDAFKGLQKTQKKSVDRQKFASEIATILAANGVPQPEIDGAVQMMTDQAVAGRNVTYLPEGIVVNGRNYDNAELGGAVGTAVAPGMGTAIGAGIGSLFGGEDRSAQLNNVARVLAPIMPQINAKLQSGFYDTGYSAEDVGKDVTRVQDLLSSRAFEAQQNANLDEFINSYPQELAAQTNDLIRAQAAQGQRFYNEELAPQIAAAANARGGLFSGDYLNELARGAADVQGGLEQSAFNAQAQDSMFFADLAYQNTLRKAIQAGQDVTGDIANQRNQIETQKQQAFTSSQADISNQFQNMLFMKQNERALAAQEAQMRRQRDFQSRQARNQTYGQMGSSVGAIGGALAGSSLGPAGAVAGASIGGSIGGYGGGVVNR